MLYQRAMDDDIARLAQSVERKALNLVVVGSSPTVGVLLVSLISRLAGAEPLHHAPTTRRTVC